MRIALFSSALLLLSFIPLLTFAASSSSENCASCTARTQNDLLIPGVKSAMVASKTVTASVCPPPGKTLVPLSKFSVQDTEPSGALVTHSVRFAAIDSCDAPHGTKHPQSLEKFLQAGGNPGIPWNVVINGGFIGWADPAEKIPSEVVAPVVHGGKVISMGNGNQRAWFRGGVAELTNGKMVICRIKKPQHSMRAQGWKDLDYIRDACGLQAGPNRKGVDVREFEGGGVLFLSHGQAVSDLYSATGQHMNHTLLLRSDLIVVAQKADGSLDFMTWYGLNTDPQVTSEMLCDAGYENAVAFDNSSGFYRRTKPEALGDWTLGGTCLGFAIQGKSQ